MRRCLPARHAENLQPCRRCPRCCRSCSSLPPVWRSPAGSCSQPWRLQRRRAALVGRPFPPAWRGILRRRVPLYRRLPPDLQRQLRGLIQIFIAEKAFIGCRGQPIDDEVRVTIAAQACLLQLNRRRPELFPHCRQILVYPGAFIVDRERGAAGGVISRAAARAARRIVVARPGDPVMVRQRRWRRARRRRPECRDARIRPSARPAERHGQRRAAAAVAGAPCALGGR